MPEDGVKRILRLQAASDAPPFWAQQLVSNLAGVAPANAESKSRPINLGEPRATVLAPGRINVLGEHIDYNGYAVAPIAIPRGMAIALWDLQRNADRIADTGTATAYSVFGSLPLKTRQELLSDPSVRLGAKLDEKRATVVWLYNTEFSAFPDCAFAFDINEPLRVEPLAASRSWRSYVEAGFRAAQDYLRANGMIGRFGRCFEGKDIVLRVSGNVPVASGLSSSSALTCASMVAACTQVLLEASGDWPEFIMNDFPPYVVRAERLVGLEGGGMDQTISLLAEPGSLSIVDFQPRMKITSYPIPGTLELFALSSLRDAHKLLISGNFYNTRVCECRIGCQLLLRKWEQEHPGVAVADRMKEVGLKAGGNEVPNGLFVARERTASLMCRDLQLIYGAESPAGMLSAVEELLEEVTLADLVSLLGCDDLADLIDKYLLGSNLMPLLVDLTPATTLVIRRRLRHVYSEAHRVCMLQRLLQDNRQEIKMFNDSYGAVCAEAGEGRAVFPDPQLENLINHLLDQIAGLMLDSHRSCAQDYECSCPELDEVTTLAVRNGASAARLTGAGFGGYAVALTEMHMHADFLHTMTEYYDGKIHDQALHYLGKSKLSDLLIQCAPDSGAQAFEGLPVWPPPAGDAGEEME